MDDNKLWYQSRTVWGGIIAVGAAAAGAFGYAIDVDTQGQLAEMIVLGASAIGGIVAIVGRVKANKVIK